MIWPLLSLLLLLHDAAAQTLTNITVDDTDPSVSYVGSWEPSASHLSSLDIGGSHTLSEDPNGSATFTFTGMSALVLKVFNSKIELTPFVAAGVAVYYLSPKWPYTVNSYVSLDGGPAVLVDMTGPPANSPNGQETIASAPLWGVTGLTNGVHRVVVTIGPSGYAVVDGFM